MPDKIYSGSRKKNKIKTQNTTCYSTEQSPQSLKISSLLRHYSKA